MSENTEIKKEELQEMARAILSEIYDAKSTRNGFEGLEIFSGVSRGTLGFADEGFRRNEERRLSYEQAYNLNRQYADAVVSDEFSPRLKRGEFLEQRVLRRKARESAIGTFGDTDEGVAEKTAVRSGTLPQTDLPEKLSDIFCRDARRYDGAFEKY